MSQFDAILLPLDGSPEAAKGAGCALWLARSLGATLHLLHATPVPLPADAALVQLGVPNAHGASVVMHQMGGSAEAAVLQEIAEHRIGLVVMSARGESACRTAALAKRLGSVAQAILEHSPVPVVLLPAHYRESLPWTTMVAAASGEAAADLALRAAAQLAAALGLAVTVVHAEDGPPTGGRMPLGRYADALAHEYPQRLDQIVERGLAGCADAEVQCVHEILLRRGDAAPVLLDLASRLGSSVLALGWHGSLGSGRALVLKRLLDEAQCPIVLVRGTERPRARLKIGNEIESG